MLKTALLILVLFTLIGEIYYQTQARPVVTQVLAAETTNTIDIAHLQKLQAFWQDTILHSPTYRDAFVQLAYINQALGNVNEAQEWWTKVYSLDPNFQPVRPL